MTLTVNELVERVVEYVDRYPDSGKKPVVIYHQEHGQTYPLNVVDASRNEELTFITDNNLDGVPDTRRVDSDMDELLDQLNTAINRLQELFECGEELVFKTGPNGRSYCIVECP